MEYKGLQTLRFTPRVWEPVVKLTVIMTSLWQSVKIYLMDSLVLLRILMKIPCAIGKSELHTRGNRPLRQLLTGVLDATPKASISPRTYSNNLRRCLLVVFTKLHGNGAPIAEHQGLCPPSRKRSALPLHHFHNTPSIS